MKTRILLPVVLFLSISLSIEAQFSYGIRVGMSSSNMKLKNFTTQDYQLKYNRGDFGYHFGVIGKVKLLKFFIQPELLFSVAKVDLSYQDLTTFDSIHYGKENFYSLDLPVMAGYKLGPLKLEVGPVATWLFGYKSSLMDSYNLKQNLNTMTVGYQAGLGVELGGLIIDAKYEGNLSKLGTGMKIAGTDVKFDQRLSKLLLSVGYLF